jgi:23S rRNA (cytosine1962-C5)-methyltransferase
MTISNQNEVVLKPGREKPVRQGHPWIFSGAIASLPEAIPDGEIVSVVSSTGKWLAQGYLNRRSQIQVRILSQDPAESIDEGFWRRRLQQAVSMRADLVASPHTNAYRLVNAESDYLPGLTVDRYADYLVFQAGTLAIDQRKPMLVQLLMELTGASGVVERSELALRKQEGLPEASGLLAGIQPPDHVEVTELGHRFLVDLATGQKTGFYMDQRENRRRVAEYCAGKTVLNAFAYTGAFAVYALAAGAQQVVNIDSSVEALTLGEENLRLNGFDPDRQCESLAGDVFQILRDWRETPDRRFDVIILDPPKFAQSRRNVSSALRGYKDINLSAIRLLKPGGILATFSCSGLVSPDLFQKVVFGAAVDAQRPLQILEWLQQSPDHPVAITFPEGLYLKGLICRAGAVQS